MCLCRISWEDWLVPNQTDYLIVEDEVPLGTVSLTRLNFRRRVFFWRKGSFNDTSLRALMRRNPPQASPDEPIDDVLERMAANSLTIIPVHDRFSGAFQGMVDSREILELVALMDEIREEARRMSGGCCGGFRNSLTIVVSPKKESERKNPATEAGLFLIQDGICLQVGEARVSLIGAISFSLQAS